MERFCRHAGHPEWGVGLVIWGDAATQEMSLWFEHGGLQTVSVKTRVLLPVAAEAIDVDVRAQLSARAKGRAPEPRASRLVRRREPREPIVPAKPTEDDSLDVMDRRRRAPGSYETGKRR